jgi:MoaA/NifB/PqqE/SkfB family radical SAM enzyme
MTLKRNKNFCIMPHTHMEIAPRGHALPCCAFKLEKLGDTFGISQPNVSKSPIKTIFEKHYIWEKSRTLSLKNEINPACQQCHSEEEAGLRSYRMNSNDKFYDYINLDEDRHKLLSLELKLGAKCNLACRICSSQHSNKLLKEDSFKIFGKANKEWMRDMQSKSEWATSDDWWEQVYDISKDLKYIKFTGGEPLIIEQHFKYLEWLAENGLDPEISYITNGTVELSDKIKSIWSKFSKVHMSVSLDAVDELGEYIRTNSQWEEQKKNLDDYIKFLGIQNVTVTCTVSVLNVHKVGNFINFFKNNDKSQIGIVFNILVSPKEFAIRNLNDKSKNYLNLVYNNLINTNEEMPEHIINGLKNIQNSFNRECLQNIDIASAIIKKDELYNLVNNGKQHNYKKLEPEWFEIIKEGEKC